MDCRFLPLLLGSVTGRESFEVETGYFRSRSVGSTVSTILNPRELEGLFSSVLSAFFLPLRLLRGLSNSTNTSACNELWVWRVVRLLSLKEGFVTDGGADFTFLNPLLVTLDEVSVCLGVFCWLREAYLAWRWLFWLENGLLSLAALIFNGNLTWGLPGLDGLQKVNNYVYLSPNSLCPSSLSFLIQHLKNRTIQGWTGKQLPFKLMQPSSYHYLKYWNLLIRYYVKHLL